MRRPYNPASLDDYEQPVGRTDQQLSVLEGKSVGDRPLLLAFCQKSAGTVPVCSSNQNACAHIQTLLQQVVEHRVRELHLRDRSGREGSVPL